MQLVKSTNQSDFQTRLQNSPIPGVKTIQLTAQEWVDLENHALQRDHELRMPKMKPIFEMALPTLFIQFCAIEITKGFEFTIKSTGEKIHIYPGFQKADRHTTAEYWKQYPDSMPSHNINVDVIQVDNAELYQAVYNSFNSQESVDGVTNKIQGALRILGMRDKVTSSVVRGGRFGTALNLAYPGNPKDDIIEKVSYFREEIIFLDNMNMFRPEDKDLRFQALYAACLMFAKMFLTKDIDSTNYAKLRHGIHKLATIKSDGLVTSDTKWDGITAILFQCFNETKRNWVPEGMLRKTNYESIPHQMSFFLYCMIELWMADKLHHKTNGFRPTSWMEYQEDSDAEPINYYEFIKSRI